MRVLVVALCLCATGAGAGDALLTGLVTHVRDGDTIEVGAQAVRLNGVAAPELDAPGGAAAAAFMQALVEGRFVRCALDGSVTHDRVVGVCWLGPVDIGAAVIAAGLARDCPYFSGGRYAALETDAGRRLPLPGYCLR